MIDLNKNVSINIGFITNLPEKIKNFIKKLYLNKTTTKNKIDSEIEKYKLDKDFDKFSRMSTSEIKSLYKKNV
jgi:hypothetical protein